MTNTTVDHDEIRSWAESKGGKPAAVDRTHQDGEVGLIRIMFPDSKQSEHQSLVEITWDEFFEKFDESNLALLYNEDNLFNKLVGRDTAEHREHGEHSSRHHPAQSAKHSNDHDSGSSKSDHAGPKDDSDPRTYKDADGNVHHHTKSYMEKHPKG